MHYSSQTKSTTYVKANATEVQQGLALLKILTLGEQQIEQGKVVPAADTIARVRARRDMQALLQRRLLRI